MSHPSTPCTRTNASPTRVLSGSPVAPTQASSSRLEPRLRRSLGSRRTKPDLADPTNLNANGGAYRSGSGHGWAAARRATVTGAPGAVGSNVRVHVNTSPPRRSPRPRTARPTGSPAPAARGCGGRSAACHRPARRGRPMSRVDLCTAVRRCCYLPSSCFPAVGSQTRGSEDPHAVPCHPGAHARDLSAR